jgi:CO/xanthine dehydrogenase FAD-binding subunit
MATYIRARTLDEALQARAAGPLTVLAGGTDVYPARAARVGWGDPTVPDVLDIGAIDDLKGITVAADGTVRIGALTTWSTVATAKLPPLFDGLRTAAGTVGGRQVQNRGTVAGNLCTASPAGDGIPCLFALDASVEVSRLGGRRTLPVSDFVTGYRRTALADDEIVTAITVPAPLPGETGAFLKLGSRAYLVISIVMVAGTLAVDANGRIARARIAVGACAPVARRLPGLEARLVGLDPAAAAAAMDPSDMASLDPIDDVRASGAYRRHAAAALVRDLLSGFADSRGRRAA